MVSSALMETVVPPSQDAVARPNDFEHLVSNCPYLGKMVEKVIWLQLLRIPKKIYYLDPLLLGFKLD